MVSEITRQRRDSPAFQLFYHGTGQSAIIRHIKQAETGQGLRDVNS
jgi:hypothetical protein